MAGVRREIPACFGRLQHTRTNAVLPVVLPHTLLLDLPVPAGVRCLRKVPLIGKKFLFWRHHFILFVESVHQNVPVQNQFQNLNSSEVVKGHACPI